MSATSDHKRRVASVYNLAAPGYDKPAVQFFPRVARRLIAFAGLQSGQTVLDVATGTGAVALPAAQAVGPNGSVVGVDLAQDMLAQARRNAEAAGIMNLVFQEGDAEALPMASDHFDAALCSAGIFFLPDMQAGLREWQRVVRRGGTVAFSSFGPTAFEPLSSLFAARIRSFGIPLGAERPFLWQRLSHSGDCVALLEATGFAQIEHEEQQLGYWLPDTAAWWEILWGTGFRGPMSQLSPDQLKAFRAQHLEEVENLRTEQGIWLDIAAFFVKGIKP